jgi:hypothetical protein
MKTFTHFNKWLLAVCLLLAMLVSSLSAQIIGDDEEEETVNIVKADKFLVKVNGKPVEITENLEIPEGQRLYINVTQLKPGTYVMVKFQKLGMKVAETKMFLANHQGAVDLEVQTPKPGVGGTAFLKYTASSGKEVEMKIKVKFNKNLKI